MKKAAAIVLAMGAAVFLAALPAPAREDGLGAVRAINKSGDWVELDCENGKVRISKVGDSIIHIKATDRPAFSDFPSFSIQESVNEQAPDYEEIESEEEGALLVFKAGNVTAVMRKSDSRLDVIDEGGHAIVTESDADGGGMFFNGGVECVKTMPPGEHYYGFGEKTGPLDKRGERMVMWNSDMPYQDKKDPLYQSHPFFMAIRKGMAYGLFFDNTFKSTFDMGHARPDRYSFFAEGGELNYWLLAGPAPADVLSRWGGLVGRMPPPPLWGLGNHQCRWSYKTADRVREIRDGFIANDIPLDAIYLDIHYMRGYRVFTFNDKSFPDPGGLIAELLDDGIKTVVIVDPGVKIDPGYGPYEEGLEKGYFVSDVDGRPFEARVWPGDVHFPDFHRAEVRRWWGEKHKFYTDLGVAGIWNDMNEPAGWKRDIRVLDYMAPYQDVDWSRMRHGQPPALVPHARIHNVYALLEAEATYNGLLEQRPDARPFVITRAGFPGVQRYSLIWTGDNFSTWKSMRASVPMLLNMGLSGLAFVGADIGGFGGTPTKELFTRWVELGAFYPFCRNHTSANMPNQEPWAFNDRVTAISRDAVKLRYRLMPYTYSLFHAAAEIGTPVMRAMVFEFPDDENVANLSDQFMWGWGLLAAPVLEKGRDRRRVYFPQGAWYDFYSGEKYDGPGWQEVPAPLERTPLFAREGAIIPLGPDMRHTGEKPWDPLTTRIYPAFDPPTRMFSLYEDDGISFDCQKGVYAVTEINTEDVPGGVEISIGARKGSFDPRRKEMVLEVFGQSPDAKITVTDRAKKPMPAASASYDRLQGPWIIRLPDDGNGCIVRISGGK